MIELKHKEKHIPQESTESRNKFVERFDWTETILTETEKQAFEDVLVDYHNTFARHKIQVETNSKRRQSCLKPKHTNAPIHLKRDLIVVLALIHKNGIITVLLFFQYASPMFAQRKFNAKLRLLVDLRKIRSLIAMTRLIIITVTTVCFNASSQASLRALLTE